ncbi:unnamed protein product, partial [Candidula unifasciata]
MLLFCVLTYLLFCVLTCLLFCLLTCLLFCVLTCLLFCVLTCLLFCVLTCLLFCVLTCLLFCVLTCLLFCVLTCLLFCVLTCLLTFAGPECWKYVAADIYTLADASNSIFPVGWGRELAFIANLAKAFILGPKDVQVAFGIFSTKFEHIIDLNRYTDSDQFAADVLGTTQLRELTFTYDALIAINREGYLTNSSRGARPNKPKVLIVITDGQSDNITKTLQAAEDLRKQNITIFAIGVGITNLVELQGIASGPESVFSVKNFAALDSIRDQITTTVCEDLTKKEEQMDDGRYNNKRKNKW